MMAGEFCFTQTDDGKIVEVSYPDGESTEAVNFKKGIVAAFQTNFKGTAEQEEEDTTSLHKSAYRCVYTVATCVDNILSIGMLREVQRSQRTAPCKAPMCMSLLGVHLRKTSRLLQTSRLSTMAKCSLDLKDQPPLFSQQGWEIWTRPGLQQLLHDSIQLLVCWQNYQSTSRRCKRGRDDKCSEEGPLD